ncbi:spore coat-associated protein camelysin [Kingella negevensis]|uniref:Lipoprotein n=1 Tax=Kingella negevensis TaxID=1522312 RepID=A0A238T992_9NEIS|nr:spore coat-associated protein camelysin [Kingella negevensis]MDK4680278.1 spore coat-associated protein camelysin [Kingella negevensis]MDK4682002.1 spore coat-associated protein camelysin [Kingella negevensis]MDK4684691.1 spore coat-associated protein camelysin [Kingella negevensis]MDK4690198.1 spore coat-associated protein camelysin [Kingella negevensis]MDK4692457.1 spore coat-associated protein camelysin [Kingella negevensis]
MKKLNLLMCLWLTGCIYAETPDGRYAELDLPVQTQTTIHKTVTVNAPPGTIVNISETPVYENNTCRCYYDDYECRRVCYY